MAESGPARRITPEDVLDVFRARDQPNEPLTATEVADALGCSRRTALDRLHDLAEQGEVASKKVGARARVWWTPLDPVSVRGADSEDDPLFDLPTFSGGPPTDVSERVDEHIAAGLIDETDTDE